MDIVGKGYEQIKSVCFHELSIINFYQSCSYLVLTARVLILLMDMMCLKRLHLLQTSKLFQHVETKLQQCNKLLIKHWNCDKLLICLLWWTWLIPTSVTVRNITFWKEIQLHGQMMYNVHLISHSAY